jgi:hypothetical protein
MVTQRAGRATAIQSLIDTMSNENQGPPVWKLLGGDGSRDQPYIIGPTSYFFSTGMQRMIIEKAYGAGEYSPDSRQRRYYESPRGVPGNKDLCEHILLKSGRSVWFDLSEVTNYQAAHPNATEESMRILGADQDQVDRAKQHMATGGRSGMQPKRSGCLGLAVVVVVMLIAGAFVVRAVAVAGRL